MTLRANVKDRNHEPWFNDDTKNYGKIKFILAHNMLIIKKKLENKLGKIVSNDIDISTNEILEDLEKPSRQEIGKQKEW